MIAACCFDRRNLEKLLRDMLIEEDVSHTLVQPLMKLYKRLYTDAHSRINQLVEIISDIRMPITTSQSTVSKEVKRKVDLKVITHKSRSRICELQDVD